MTLIHAALLIFYELLDPRSDQMNYMEKYFYQILNDCVMRVEIKNHTHPLILNHVVSLLPRLANYCLIKMMPMYVSTCIQYLTEVLSRGEMKKEYNESRSVVFRSLGQLSNVPKVRKAFSVHVPTVLDIIKRGISPNSYYQTISNNNGNKSSVKIPKHHIPPCEEALNCLEVVVR